MAERAMRRRGSLDRDPARRDPVSLSRLRSFLPKPNLLRERTGFVRARKSGAIAKAILLCLFVLRGGSAGAETGLQSPGEAPVIAVAGAGGLGEISQYTAEGTLMARWTGFSDIETVEIARSGRLMILESGGARLVELDRSGVMHRLGSSRQRTVFQEAVLPNGHFLLAAGKEGVVELDSSGKITWRALPPDRAAEIVGAVRLADGTTLCVARFGAALMYQIPAGSTQFIPVVLPEVGPFNDPWLRPGLRVLDSTAQQVAIWYKPWNRWYQLQWKNGGLERQTSFPAKGNVSAVARGRGGAAWVAEAEFEAVRYSASGQETGSFAVADAIRDIAQGDDGSVFVAVERTPEAARPAHRPPSPYHAPFSWIRLGLWVAGSLLVIGVLQVMTWRNAAAAPASATSPAEASHGPWRNLSVSRQQLWIPFAAATAIGFGMAGAGCVRLYRGAPHRAIPLLLAGALLAAVAGQLWSRVICGEVDQWWVRVEAARFPRWLRLPTWCTVAAVLAGGFVLWRWRSAGGHGNDSISLWVFLQLLCVGLLALTPRRPRLREWKIPWETLLHVAGLILLASVVLSTDLAGVPQNVHNDVGSVVDSALRLLEGRVDDFFSSGYAEVPYPGHLPTSLGLLIAGKTVAGSRLGVLLTGILAVLGTYALGREYKSARLGLFASLLLLASIPFLHFSRLTHFGEVAAYAVWLLYLLLRAVRTAHPGAWLVSGVVGGWGLFLFFSARVALAGVLVAGILLALRSPRVTLRRWYGPLLFALGFAITVLPMVLYWRSHPLAFFSRMDTSFSLYDPQGGFHGDVLARALGKPFLKTLGMFYNEMDGSGQGTLSPAAGPIEATLLSIGLAVVLTDGWGANVACLGWFVTMLLGCGVFAQATPWYTRLVPVTPVASLFMARAIDLLLNTMPLKRPAFKRLTTAVICAALIGLAATNLKTYLRFERARSATDFTAFGRAAVALGSRYQFYCVTFQRPEFSCLHPSFVPYLSTLDVRDLHDPFRAIPSSPERPVAIMIPFWRFVPRPLDPNALVDQVVSRRPGAKLRYVYEHEGASGRPLGAIVFAR